MTSFRCGTPDVARSGPGKETDEKLMTEEGQALLIRMSMSCEGAAADFIAANDV